MKRCPNPACASMQFPDEANFCPNCAQRLVAAAHEAPAPAAGGDLLDGRFAVGRRIGGNRTGEVHEATDRQTSSACVVKWVHAAVFPTPLLQQRTERELKQLERVGARTLAKVLGHGKQGDRLWVATEKVGGQTLKALMGQGPLSIDRAKAILVQIGDALSEAAKVGVIHRDVSPKNVLVGASDEAKLINFGIPTPLDGNVQGEPEFLSPEQVEGKPVDQRANIYSLGAVFYYMVTGQPPFVGDPRAVMQAHLAGNLVPPSQRGAVPPAVEAIIVKALERQPSRRYMTLRQLLGEIERADGAGAADSASQTSPFAAAGKGKAGADAARTMMGMFAPGVSPIGPDGKPTEPVAVSPVAPQPAPPAAVATFAQPTPQPHRVPTPQPMPSPQLAAQPAGQLPSPVVPHQPAAPSLPAAPAAGGKRKAEPEPKKKGQFRETLWFKKGELDAVAAEAAAAAAATGKDELATDKADSLPMEDRYKDDGSVSVQDQRAYSLRTGHTQMMRSVDPRQGGGPGVSEDDLIGEMKAGRGKVMLIIVIALIAVGGVVAFFVLK